MKDRLETRVLNHDEELLKEERNQWDVEDNLKDANKQIRHLKNEIKREKKGYSDLATQKEALMDDNAELRSNIDQIFTMMDMYEHKNFFPLNKFLLLKGEIVKKDLDRPILERYQGCLNTLQTKLEKEKKLGANQQVTIRQLRKQLRDVEDGYDKQLGDLKEELEAVKDHNFGLQGSIDTLQQIAEQEK